MTTVENFREELDKNLRAEFSWLSLTGLCWLDEGENTFGSGAGNTIVLPEGSTPEFAGAFMLSDHAVQVKFAEGMEGMVGDEMVSSSEMRPDVSGEPTFLHLNDMRFVVIERGGKLAIRHWWRKNPTRLNFEGRKWYAEDEAYRFTAKIKTYDPPKKVVIPDMIGNEFESEMEVRLLMKKDGEPFGLDAIQLPDGRFYIVFKDATAKTTTYPAARFLLTEISEGETVLVDFNKAYSPPCAFTPYATCPLPTPENVLTVAIEAGEQYVRSN